MRTAQTAKLITINVLIFVFLLAGIEIFFRLFVTEKGNATGLNWQTLRPYVMFSTPHVASKGFVWDDQYHKRQIGAQISNDQFGFAMTEDVSLSRIRPKAENERVVVFSGGSAAWGVGASSDATTIAGQLESKLNAAQNRFQYRVLNLSMGGWTAYQQFIALAMYGHNLQPDWIVTMDGFNDGAVACAHSQGAGYPLYYGLMEAFFQAYMFGQTQPTLYRGWLENQLTFYSKAYRVLTGKKYIDVKLKIDPSQDDVTKEVVRNASWTDLEEQLAFYVGIQQRLIDIFPEARVLLTTQPVGDDFNGAFAHIYDAYGTPGEEIAVQQLTSRLDAIQRNHRDSKCGTAIWKSARDYFLGRASMMIDSLVQKNREKRKAVFYANAGTIFPASFEGRRDFFIDSVHLNDAGMERVADLYSKIILAEDLPKQFAPVVWRGPKADRDLFQARGQDVPWIATGTLAATYGKSCEGVTPPIGANNFYEGNATDYVLRVCSAKSARTCEIPIDVQQIGDPVNGCGKDFAVSWRCADSRETREVHLDGEANGKTATISCL